MAQSSTIATSAPTPPCRIALGDERPTDEGERRAHELHDFNFVTAGVGREPHDVGHRQRRGDSEQRDDDAARRCGRTGRRSRVGSASAGRSARPRRPVRAAEARRRARPRPPVVARAPAPSRTSIDAGNGLRSSRSVAPARSGKSSRNRASASAFDRYCRPSARPPWSISASSACTCSRRRVVLEVHRHLGGFAPAPDDALEVGVHHQEEAEHEEPGGDREDGEHRRAPAAQQALGRFVEEVLAAARMASDQVTSHDRARDRASARGGRRAGSARGRGSRRRRSCRAR